MLKKLSSFFTLNVKDFIKGLITAVFGAIIGIVGPSIESGSWTFDWQNIWHMAAGAAVAYLMKNLLSNSKGEFLKKDQPPV